MESENDGRVVTRAAKRKIMASQLQTQQGNKKRVALGELTNLTDSISKSRRCIPLPSEQKRTESVKKPLLPKETGCKPAICIGEKPFDHPRSDGQLEDSEDPQMCASYSSDIYCYLRKLEVVQKRMPRSDYIESVQKDVTPNMRGMLVDWLVEVADEYRLLSETLYLTVNCIDRFLSITSLHRQKLQLLGVSAMLVASKYEEIKPPNVEDFCYITDNTYTKQEVLKMESDILNALKFDLGNPTVKTFLRKLTRVAQQDFASESLQLEFLGCFLAELSLLDYKLVKFRPSMTAASVIFLARYVLRPNEFPWNPILQESSGYRAVDLQACASGLFDLYLGKREGLHAVREKYRQHKYKWVSLTPSPNHIPTSYFEDYNPDDTL